MNNKNMFIQQCAIFIALLVVGAQLSISSGSVPFTLQTIVIIVIALTSSLYITFTSISIYLLMGLIGMPVFANATGGPGVFGSISGGFLVGFLVMGSVLAIVKFKNIFINSCYCLVFTFGIYLFGVLGALIVHKWTFETSLTWLVKPYILIDLSKIIVGVIIANRINNINIFKTNYNKISSHKLTIKK